MRTFDGSKGEGGGAILRLVSALALITQEPIQIINIRKNRPKPGLQTQHLMGIQAIALFCGGELEGDRLGSETLIFSPSNTWKSELTISVSTAGSIGLILQLFQLALIAFKNSKTKLQFKGGATFGKWAPTLPYVEHVTWEVLRNLGLSYKLEIRRHGFFPRGGAEVIAELQVPSKISGTSLIDFKDPKEIFIQSYSTNHLRNARVGERQIQSVKRSLKSLNIPLIETINYVDAWNPGSGVLIYSNLTNGVIGADYIGEKHVSSEKVGQEAGNRFLFTFNRGCVVDPYLADQILPIMAVADQNSSFTTPMITNHTKTNMELLMEILGIIITIEEENQHYKVSIDV